MNPITEKQADFIRSLIARIEARKVVAPRKASRWNDPVRAHAEHVAAAREILAALDAGAMTVSTAATHISSLSAWASAR